MRAKYTVAIVVLVILGVIAAEMAFRVTHRVDEKPVTLRSTLSGETIQQLVRRSSECHEPQPGEPVGRDADYCAEVFRAIEARPLQIQQIRPLELTVPATSPPKHH
ncbi:MAG TPA: hypothetical protein VGI90_10285 [Steroidobacteraceae bacterium]